MNQEQDNELSCTVMAQQIETIRSQFRRLNFVSTETITAALKLQTPSKILNKLVPLVFNDIKCLKFSDDSAAWPIGLETNRGHFLEFGQVVVLAGYHITPPWIDAVKNLGQWLIDVELAMKNAVHAKILEGIKSTEKQYYPGNIPTVLAWINFVKEVEELVFTRKFFTGLTDEHDLEKVVWSEIHTPLPVELTRLSRATIKLLCENRDDLHETWRKKVVKLRWLENDLHVDVGHFRAKYGYEFLDRRDDITFTAACVEPGFYNRTPTDFNFQRDYESILGLANLKGKCVFHEQCTENTTAADLFRVFSGAEGSCCWLVMTDFNKVPDYQCAGEQRCTWAYSYFPGKIVHRIEALFIEGNLTEKMKVQFTTI